MGDYWAAGASGFGLGSALFTPDKAVPAIGRDARRFVDAMQRLLG
jgi:hypothetical protein